MAGACNRVIAGDHKGLAVAAVLGSPYIVTSWKTQIDINRETVESYELISDEHRKSAKSGAARGLVGAALLGPAGLLAGGLSAKSKGVYQVAIHFKSGEKCLVEVDDKIYNAIVRCCF